MATAENLPVYRMPHVPHRGRLIAAAIMAVTLAAVSRGALENSSETTVQPRPGAVDPEQMRFPLGEQNLRLVLDSSGIIVPEYTITPQILEDNNTQVHYFVPKLGDKYEEVLEEGEIGYGDVTVIVGKDNPDVLNGGIWVEASDVNGNPVDSDGIPLQEGDSPILYKLKTVEFTQIPQQEVSPVLASVS